MVGPRRQELRPLFTRRHYAAPRLHFSAPDDSRHFMHAGLTTSRRSSCRAEASQNFISPPSGIDFHLFRQHARAEALRAAAGIA